MRDAPPLSTNGGLQFVLNLFLRNSLKIRVTTHCAIIPEVREVLLRRLHLRRDTLQPKIDIPNVPISTFNETTNVFYMLNVP